MMEHSTTPATAGGTQCRCGLLPQAPYLGVVMIIGVQVAWGVIVIVTVIVIGNLIVIVGKSAVMPVSSTGGSFTATAKDGR